MPGSRWMLAALPCAKPTRKGMFVPHSISARVSKAVFVFLSPRALSPCASGMLRLSHYVGAVKVCQASDERVRNFLPSEH